jgi:hypothetical protein
MMTICHANGYIKGHINRHTKGHAKGHTEGHAKGTFQIDQTDQPRPQFMPKKLPSTNEKFNTKALVRNVFKT